MNSSEWREISLGDICQFKYGKSLPASSRTPGHVPVFGSNGQIDTHSTPLTSGPTIVVGRKGSFGEVHYSEVSCWPIDTTYYIDLTATEVDLRWLYHHLDHLGLKALNRSAAIPGLNRDDAYKKRLLLPPIGEQKRIAEVLDQADGLRTKRRQAIALLGDAAISIFLDLFGTPSTDWTSVTVEKLATEGRNAIRTGPFGSQLRHSEFVENGIPVLGIDNVVANEFNWTGKRFITESKYRKLARYRVLPEDVLITIMGTCGRCAIAPEDIPIAINTKHLCCITLDQKKCLPEFLQGYFLMHPIARSYLHKRAKGAIMSGLNMGIIKELPVMLPPIVEQRRYVETSRELQALKQRSTVQLAELDELFNSLKWRALSGQL